MCCFSIPVDAVTGTNIFARGAEDGRQYLVYSMTLSAREDLAMILPIPVPQESPEDAVRFIDLSHYSHFFKDLQGGFPLTRVGSAGPRPGTLKVVEVGSFEASFVPSVADFRRLDERFRLPDDVWSRLPAYQDFGFAVFKLKKGAATIHPMAFEFPRAKPDKLFFPTVHIHDGAVHSRARFDHALYCQENEGDRLRLRNWASTERAAGEFMQIEAAKGLVNPDKPCHMMRILGMHKNEDIVL